MTADEKTAKTVRAQNAVSKRRLRIAGIYTLALCALFAAIYSAFWFYAAHQLKQDALRIAEDFRARGIKMDSTPPALEGFPGAPRLRYQNILLSPDDSAAADGTNVQQAAKRGRAENTGGNTDTAALAIPALSVQSFFTPGSSVHISLPRGAALYGAGRQIVSLDRLDADLTLPERFPKNLSAPSLSRWRQSDTARLTLNALDIRRDSLNIHGNGYLALDDSLQPAGLFEINTTGHMALIDDLESGGILNTGAAAILRMALAAVSDRQNAQGAQVLETTIRIRNSALYLGPLRVASLPQFVWPADPSDDRDSFGSDSSLPDPGPALPPFPQAGVPDTRNPPARPQ